MSGLVGLWKSRKACLCLIILAISSVALFLGKMNGLEFSAVVSSIVLIYNYCQHRVDLGTIQTQATQLGIIPQGTADDTIRK